MMSKKRVKKEAIIDFKWCFPELQTTFPLVDTIVSVYGKNMNSRKKVIKTRHAYFWKSYTYKIDTR